MTDLEKKVIQEQIEAISALTRISVDEIEYDGDGYFRGKGHMFRVATERGHYGQYLGEIGCYIVRKIK